MSAKRDQGILARYLLGELPEDECIRIEQDCLDNDERFEELEAVEAELTDDYVRGILTGRRRKHFEKRLLDSPGLVKRLGFAKLMVGEPPPTLVSRVRAWWVGSRGPARWLPVPVLAATVLTAIWAGLFWFRQPVAEPLQPRLARSSPLAVRETPKPPQPPLTNRKPSPEQTIPAAGVRSIAKPSFIATFALAPGGVRGGSSANEIQIPRGARQVRFKIDLPSKGYRIYRASLNRVEGERVFAPNNVQVRPSHSGVTLFIEMPARVIPVGTSVLAVIGVGANGVEENVGQYVVRVASL